MHKHLLKGHYEHPKRLSSLGATFMDRKQAGHFWNQYLGDSTEEVGFSASEFDPCLYYRQNVIMLGYIDDCIMFNPCPQVIDKTIKDLQHSEKKIVIIELGDVSDIMGIEVSSLEDGLIKLSQLYLINSILTINISKRTHMRNQPHCDLDVEPAFPLQRCH